MPHTHNRGRVRRAFVPTLLFLAAIQPVVGSSVAAETETLPQRVQQPTHHLEFPPYEPEAVKYRTLLDQWSWDYNVETKKTELHWTVTGPLPKGRLEDSFDEFVYWNLAIPTTRLRRAEPRFDRMIRWIDKKLNRRLRKAGLFDPDREVYPTRAEVLPVLEPLLNLRSGVWFVRGRSVMGWLTESTPPLPGDFPAVPRARAEAYPERGFVTGVEGIGMLPFLPFEYCGGNELLVTKRDPEAAKAHSWLSKHDAEYRDRVQAIVDRFTEEFHPQQESELNVTRLKLLSRLLQVRMQEAGIDEEIRNRMNRRGRNGADAADPGKGR